MNIGFIGLGKLGLPVALAIESRGHVVEGFDIDPRVADTLQTRKLPCQEEGAQALLNTTRIRLRTVAQLVASADIVFVAVQTPHEARFEGVTRLPDDRADFDYTWLREAVRQVNAEVMRQQRLLPLAVISTVLPGTMAREIAPILDEKCQLVYNPFFIAMGTAIRDFLAPEFVLLGSDHEWARLRLEQFYRSIHNRPILPMSVAEAELTKVAYNTFIGQKIVFANTLMEICHKTGCNVDVVTGALAQATDRLISPRYLRGGMGDGGGCHPRDNIALSWLARKLDLSHDIFGDIMQAREDQTEWLADLIEDHYNKRPVVLLGTAFKKGTSIITGSPALLLSETLNEKGIGHLFFTPAGYCSYYSPACYFISTNHAEWHNFPFREGDLVLDPWREYEAAAKRGGAQYIGIGSPPKPVAAPYIHHGATL